MAQLGTALGVVDGGSLAALEAAVTTQVLASGSTLFREGDASDAMYLVLRGELEAAVDTPEHGTIVVGRIGPGEPVGEMQIISGGRRTATVVATSETELARIERAAIERLAHHDPAAMSHLADGIRRRVRRNQLAAILPSLLGSVDEAMLRDVEAAVTWMTLSRGTILFEEGDPGDRAYILVSGRLQASVRDAAGRDRVVGEIARGEVVGEMAIFTGEPRSARVRALRDSELVSLDRPAFEQLIAGRPQTLLGLTRLVVQRLRRAQGSAPAESAAKTFAVVAADPGVPLADFTRRLAAALGEVGSTLHLAAADLDRLLGTPGLAQVAPDDPHAPRIASWIDEQETRYRFVVLEADATASAWSARCVRQADRLLVVGRAGDDPTPGETERQLCAADATTAAVPTSLVLLHPPETRLPAGTRRWLEGRSLLRHHHVRVDDQESLARVARFMACRAVGIALSGGGARGLAHVGVLDAVLEAGIPIDAIGGTSMGAVIAAECALGWDSPTMARQNQAIFGRWRRDLTLPLLSILGGHRSSARLRESIGDVQIEDLWLPYFCVSSNLSRAQMMVHRAGPLWLGLRASISLPGILPPVAHEGDLLVDGALLRNLPADVMREAIGGGTIIAVDVSAETDMQHEHPYQDSISGWRILWSRLNPFTQALPVPNIAAVLQRSAELASVVMQREALLRGIDLYIRVPLKQFGMLDFHQASDIIAAGHGVAREKLAEWRPAAADRVPEGRT
jgi:predicted acylesterase/phospholipase RssA/CRP-like cAMP-binding protein